MAQDTDLDGKARVLWEHGVLNAKPDEVRDERFRSSEFFDPRDLVQVKYEMLRRVRTEGATVTEAVEAFGFSRPTFYYARQAVDEEGLVGLVPRKSGPKKPHKLTEEVMAFVEERRVEEPGVSSGDLAVYVENRFGLRVHRRSIERALTRRKKKPQRTR